MKGPRRFPVRALLLLVGAAGFELATSSSQSWRSTRLSYTPIAHLLPRRGAPGNGASR